MGGDYVTLLDTNVFYNFLFEAELTDKAAEILEMNEEFYTTFTVLNEVVYVISRKLAEKKYGIRSYYEFRSLIAKEGYGFCAQEIKSLLKLLEDLRITVFSDYQNADEVCKIMSKYKPQRCPDSSNMQTLWHQKDRQPSTKTSSELTSSRLLKFSDETLFSCQPKLLPCQR